ncbi:ABC transporter ATP-binding protein [Candidatus Thorarchaeota archaeon]|nr:MAG: ABC transporter ATP-binding protein [Candidatus Thorarchaeota archaeon]
MMVDVELRGIIRKFEDGTHIGPIDLKVKDGELLTLLGPSGSGKTTTLRMIAGFIEADKGQLLFDNVDMVDVSSRERSIGMVFQSVALFPNMTVYQNIAFGPDMAEWSQERTVARVEELAELLGIRHLLFRKISEISGGEAQRVGLARALAKEPRLLLLDEPLSALDPQLRERLQLEIRRVQQKLGITTIYVTHSQDEAFAISDRVAVIDDGRIIQVGTPEDLYNAPVNEFVARFLGSGNVFCGVIREANNSNLIVEVNKLKFFIKGVGTVGEELKFTVKPEDIILNQQDDENSIKGEILSITPLVGLFKIAIALNGETVYAITQDENIIKQLRGSKEKLISFFFSPSAAVIISD